jgi:hypothetical protein
LSNLDIGVSPFDQVPSFRLGPGLAALVGGDGPLRSDVLERYAGPLVKGDERLATLVAGHGLGEPAQAWRRAARVLAQWLGMDGVDNEISNLQGEGAASSSPTSLDSGVENLRARVQELRRLPEAVRMKEREVREMRADAVEVNGDMEVANMEWLRERQDAETHLLAYRDRARELKVRLQQLEAGGPESECPTCDRLLSERFASVLTVLREEWESVVQDGSWWKRRREQLDFKPAHLQELEGKAIRLQAAIEECAEEVERLRARLPDLADAEDTLAAVRAAGTSRDRRKATRAAQEDEISDDSDTDRRRRALEALRAELLADARDTLTARTGRYLNRLTSGGVLGVGLTGDGEPTVVRDDGERRLQSDEEVAAYLFALRLALIQLAAAQGIQFEGVLLGDTFDRLEPETKVRAVGLLRKMLPQVPRILLFCRGEILDAIPESFDWIVDLRVDRSGAPHTRVRTSGVGKLRVH